MLPSKEEEESAFQTSLLPSISETEITTLDENDGVKIITQKPALKSTQATLIYALFATLLSCNLGYRVGVTAASSEMVQRSLNLSNSKVELYLGASNLFAMIGSLLSYIVLDRFGRRYTFCLSATFSIFGYILLCAANNYGMLIAGASFLGMGEGCALVVTNVYISEIVQAAHRGQIGSWNEGALNVGILLGFISGLAFSGVSDNEAWRLMFAIGVILPGTMIYLAIYVLPESPRYLVLKGRDGEAAKVLKEMYPDRYDVKAIVNEIRKRIEKETAIEDGTGWNAILSPTPAFRRIIIVGLGMATAKMAVGIDGIQFFLVYILREGGIKSRTTLSAILIGFGAIKLASVIIAGYLLDRSGRKPLLIISLSGMVVSLLVVSGGFLSEKGGEGRISWVCIIGLGAYLAFFGIGLGPIGLLLPSEIFPTLIRDKGMALASFLNRGVSTLYSLTFLSVTAAITYQWFFLMLSIICMIILIWIHYFVPETKNRSLESMSLYFATITGDQSILNEEKKRLSRRWSERDLLKSGSRDFKI